MVEPETHCYGWRQTKQNRTTTRQLVNNRGIPKTQRVSGSTNRGIPKTQRVQARSKTVLNMYLVSFTLWVGIEKCMETLAII